ncbi:MAG: DUF4351 domain-containing protein, partial [Magnetococcales bacterium]|nr:DUF4351 domain-containing protein [Magnetococcales bacterium]
EIYDKAGMAITDARGAVELALQEGFQKGEAQGFQKGEAQGYQKGEEQGIRKGEAALLLKQLTKRFGPLPDSQVETILGADSELLERWSERIFEVGTLTELLQ